MRYDEYMSKAAKLMKEADDWLAGSDRHVGLCKSAEIYLKMAELELLRGNN